jgi:hypothetical protein
VRPIERRVIVAVLCCVLVAAVACPIQRPPVPPEYLDFRARLQTAVTDTALVEMEGLSRMQARLQSRLTDLAAITTVDSLLATLEDDQELYPLSRAVATTVRIRLEARGVSGSVRNAFANPDGQRLAVDAIVIGLGRALHLLETASLGSRLEGWGPLSGRGCLATVASPDPIALMSPRRVCPPRKEAVLGTEACLSTAVQQTHHSRTSGLLTTGWTA